MNLNNMIIENIRSHDYFKGLAELKSFDETVDQIYYDVTYVTPWKPGTHKTQRASGMCSGLRGVRCEPRAGPVPRRPPPLALSSSPLGSPSAGAERVCVRDVPQQRGRPVERLHASLQALHAPDHQKPDRAAAGSPRLGVHPRDRRALPATLLRPEDAFWLVSGAPHAIFMWMGRCTTGWAGMGRWRSLRRCFAACAVARSGVLPHHPPHLARLRGRFDKLLDDEETFNESGDGGSQTSVGRFVRKILLEQEYHDTMLPRLPVPVARDIQKKLDERPTRVRGAPLSGGARGGGRDGAGRSVLRHSELKGGAPTWHSIPTPNPHNCGPPRVRRPLRLPPHRPPTFAVSLTPHDATPPCAARHRDRWRIRAVGEARRRPRRRRPA